MKRMAALSLRQPNAEQVLRGKKKIEYRNMPTEGSRQTAGAGGRETSFRPRCKDQRRFAVPRVQMVARRWTVSG
jgi:hypothetical protein